MQHRSGHSYLRSREIIAGWGRRRQTAGKDDGQSRKDRDGFLNGGGVEGGASSLLQVGVGGKNDKGTNLKTLVIELDYVSEIGFSNIWSE